MGTVSRAVDGAERPRAERRVAHLSVRVTAFARRGTSILARAARLALLLAAVGAVLVSTTVLDRSSQVALFKVGLILFLSLLPGWLYLQFIVLRGKDLYDEYVLNLYRLRIDEVANLPKPPPASSYWKEWDRRLEDVHDDDQVARNIYLKKFEAAYGRSAVPESRRKRHGDDDAPLGRSTKRIAERVQADAFSPVFLATLLFCAGWIVVLQPELYLNLPLFRDLETSGLPEVPGEQLRFGFVGAYAFVLGNLVRRYFQSDLKTKAYVNAIARVILVAALVYAIHPIWESVVGTGPWSQPTELAVAFAIGFFPELGFRILRQALARFGRQLSTPGDERHPLRELDGLSIWTQARLLEEGIEDMQNLATANLVDLMVNTRVPISCLVDWIDQSFLYLRVDRRSGDRERLRRIGIRTATDLLDAFAAADGRDPKFLPRLLRVLNRNDKGEDDRGPSVTEGLRRTLDYEVNLWHIRQWKRHDWLQDPSAVGLSTNGQSRRPAVATLSRPEGPPGDLAIERDDGS